MEPIFTHAVNLKRELLKNFQNKLDLFPSANFVTEHSFTMNPCEYSVVVLKGQGFQGKHHVRSVAIFE